MSDWVDITLLPKGEDGTDGTNGTNGIDGDKGDRYAMYAQATENPAFWDIMRRLEVWTDGVYIPVGDGEVVVTVPVTAVGNQTQAVFVMPRFRQEEGIPYIAYPEGQYCYIELATGEITETGVWFTLGDVIVAPQGIQGEPGETGATGQGNIVVVQTPVTIPSPSEVTTWSFVARRLAEIYSEATITGYETNGLAQFIAGLYRAASLYLPIQNLFELFQYYTPDFVASFESEVVIDAAARKLYCQLINHPDLSDISIGVMHDALGDPYDYAPDTDFSAEALAATVMKLADDEPYRFRSLVANLRAVAYQETTLPNYSTVTTCTPAFEDWNHVWDFTVDNGGWLSGTYSSPGTSVWVAGQGWKRFGSFISPTVRYEFGSLVNLVQVELIWFPVEIGSHTWGRGGSLGEAQQQLGARNATTTSIPHVISFAGNISLTTLYATWNAVSGVGTLARVSIAGRGYNPF